MESDQIVGDHHRAAISAADKALLDEVRKLARSSVQREGRFEAQPLRKNGFTEPQIMEAVVNVCAGKFPKYLWKPD